MLRPPKQSNTDFEKVQIGEFIFGNIEIIQHDPEHTWKGFEGKPDTVGPGVRFVFKLQGYEFKHYTNWMKFSMDKRSNLYSKYIIKLVANAKEYIDFDLEQLTGLEVKTVWDEENGYQHISNIWPVKDKITVKECSDKDEPPPPDDDDGFIPEIDEDDVPL
jgi:hypothetical protein